MNKSQAILASYSSDPEIESPTTAMPTTLISKEYIRGNIPKKTVLTNVTFIVSIQHTII